MKKSFLFLSILLLGSLSSIHAQRFSGLQKSPTDISYAKTERNAKPDIKVIYSRPQKKDREIFGNMGDKPVKAGTYSLFTIPGKKEWTVILSSELDVWGAYTYKETSDIARIKVPVSSGEALEIFSIAFKQVDNGYHMVIGWDKTRIEVPFTK